MHVLFVAHDAGGTVPPVLAVARALVQAGHQATILSQPSVAVRARGVGAEFTSFADVGDYATDTPIEEQLSTALPLLVGAAPARQAVILADAVRADAVVIDPNLGGVLAAFEADERPSAVLLHSLYATFVDVWFGELWPLLGPAINQTRGEFALGPAASWAGLFEGHDLVISPVPSMFDPGPNEDPLVRHVGFLVPPADRRASFPKGDGPRVLVSLSTTFLAQRDQLDRIIEALAQLDVQAIVTTSHVVSLEALSPPSNVEVVPFVPHAALLGTCDAVVTHGGLGTVAAALSHGVPIVCQPVARDQPLNAQRVRALGAGIVIGTSDPADSIAADLATVIGERSYRDRAEELAHASRDAGEVDAALEAILGPRQR